MSLDSVTPSVDEAVSGNFEPITKWLGEVVFYAGRDGRRVVEPGELELRLAASSADHRLVAGVTLTGPARHPDHTRRLRSMFGREPGRPPGAA
ncbi:hypothetical protein [Streptomyces sp. enrichment culture]|uniref:hypothetical protein n=1 Tax=Streptomyces sp. enrichment culture TaxID=1795815 RepID=UPI003F566451